MRPSILAALAGRCWTAQARLVGMNAAIHQEQGGFAGIGFAIPVDLISRTVPALIARTNANER
jgi:S1-C subfamily serine protease